LDTIAACESGGNPHAQNAGSTASGLYQFLDSSWRAYGGSKYGPRAKDATAAQQTEIATAAVARSGLTPWVASRHCWGGKVSTAAIPASGHASAIPALAAGRRTVHSENSAGARHSASGALDLIPRQRKSPEQGKHHSGHHKVHHTGHRSRISDIPSVSGDAHHHHLDAGESLKLPRVSDLSLSGHGSGADGN
jgi:hypothetical protein